MKFETNQIEVGKIVVEKQNIETTYKYNKPRRRICRRKIKKMEDLRQMRSEMQRPAAASTLNKIISDDSFTDVFGGAPRSIFSHQLSATGCFYDDIFWQTEKAAAAPPRRRRGRNLPLFDIPSLQQVSSNRISCRQKNGFFSDIFGWDAKKMMSSRSRSRSKTNSSSALSSEELSPLHPPPISGDGYDDVALLASKLRCLPINIIKDCFQFIVRKNSELPKFL